MIKSRGVTAQQTGHIKLAAAGAELQREAKTVCCSGRLHLGWQRSRWWVKFDIYPLILERSRDIRMGGGQGQSSGTFSACCRERGPGRPVWGGVLEVVQGDGQGQDRQRLSEGNWRNRNRLSHEEQLESTGFLSSLHVGEHQTGRFRAGGSEKAVCRATPAIRKKPDIFRGRRGLGFCIQAWNSCGVSRQHS